MNHAPDLGDDVTVFESDTRDDVAFLGTVIGFTDAFGRVAYVEPADGGRMREVVVDRLLTGVNPPCTGCGYDGFRDSDEAGTFCPECGER